MSHAVVAAALAAQAGAQQGGAQAAAGSSPAPSQATAAAQPPSAAGTPEDGDGGEGPPLQPTWTDAQLVAKLVEFGGTEEQGWHILKEADCSQYAKAFTRVRQGGVGLGCA